MWLREGGLARLKHEIEECLTCFEDIDYRKLVEESVPKETIRCSLLTTDGFQSEYMRASVGAKTEALDLLPIHTPMWKHLVGSGDSRFFDLLH